MAEFAAQLTPQMKQKALAVLADCVDVLQKAIPYRSDYPHNHQFLRAVV